MARNLSVTDNGWAIIALDHTTGNDRRFPPNTVRAQKFSTTHVGLKDDDEVEVMPLTHYLQIKLDGVTAASQQEVLDYIDANFSKASAGGGEINFTELEDTEWNGDMRKTLTANLSVTTGSKSSGLFRYTNSGSYTFTVNSVAITIRNSGTNGGRGYVTYTTDDLGDVWVTSDADNLPKVANPPAPDTTAPTVSSRATTSATNIRAVLSEVCTGTSAGYSFKKGASLGAAVNHAITGFTGSGSINFDFTVGTIAPGDGLWMSYDAGTGDTVDGNNNPLASFTDQAVINNVSNLFMDDFNAADTGDINGRTTTAGGLTWSGSGGIGITDNALISSVASGPSFTYSLPVGVRDINIEVTLGNVKASAPSLWGKLALKDALNFIQIDLVGGAVYETVSGAGSGALFAGSGASVTGDVMRFELLDDNLDVFRNGVLLGSATVSDSATLDGTGLGIFSYNDDETSIDKIEQV